MAFDMLPHNAIAPNIGSLIKCSTCRMLDLIKVSAVILQVTWADLSFQDIAFLVLELYPTCLDKAPLLKALYERVNALPLVKKYLDARPTTSI